MENQKILPHIPMKQKGCSCWLVCVCGIFGLLVILIGSLIFVTSYLERKAFDGMSQAEIAEFQQWLNAPVEVPPELKVEIPPMPEDLQQEKLAFQNASRAAAQKMNPVINMGRDSAFYKIIDGTGKVTKADWELMTTMTAPAKNLVQRGTELTNNPAFLANPNSILKPGRVAGLTLSHKMYLAYSLAQMHTGNSDESIKAIDLVRKLNDINPQASLIRAALAGVMASSSIRTIRALAEDTSNPLVLKRLKQQLVKWKENLILKHPKWMFQNGKILMLLDMQETGYIANGTFRQRDLYIRDFFYPRYLRWRIKNSPSDPRYKYWVERRSQWLRNLENPIDRFIYKSGVGIFRPLGDNLYITFKIQHLTDLWRIINGNIKGINKIRQECDLLIEKLSQ